MFGFGGSSSATEPTQEQAQASFPPQPLDIDPAAIDMASKELEMVTDTYHKLVRSCYSKCINQPALEADVLKGEGVCVDRCVAKFFETNKKIGLLMNSLGAQAQQQRNLPM